MPFNIKKSGEGYKVFSPKGAKSKKPMSKQKALAQQRAIYANWDGKEDASGPSNVDIDDNLIDQHTNLQIDGFKNPQEVIKFLEFLTNPMNLKKIKDRNTIKILYQKYNELIDFISIADPYFKAKARDMGVVLSRMTENIKGKNMNKITKLLESIETVEKLFKEAMSVPGDEWDDEGNYIGGGGGGGRRFRRYGGYNNYRRPYTPPVAPPTPAAPAAPAAGALSDEKTLKATRIANAIAKKKGLASADQGLIAWVMKQMDAGKFQEESNYALHEAKVKKELLDTSTKLLEEARKKLASRKG